MAEHNLKQAQKTKDLQKVVRWYLDADDHPDSHQNIIITHWPIHKVPWNLHANLFRGISIEPIK